MQACIDCLKAGWSLHCNLPHASCRSSVRRVCISPTLEILALRQHDICACLCAAGYSVADINYGGSTGYGREYRNRLRYNWGIVDVDDCCNAAKHLASEGKVDGKRLCITGGSAGGYTTLACLAFKCAEPR